MPSCSVMCDVVRCLIECASPEDLEEMFHVICEKMEVWAFSNNVTSFFIYGRVHVCACGPACLT